MGGVIVLQKAAEVVHIDAGLCFRVEVHDGGVVSEDGRCWHRRVGDAGLQVAPHLRVGLIGERLEGLDVEGPVPDKAVKLLAAEDTHEEGWWVGGGEEHAGHNAREGGVGVGPGQPHVPVEPAGVGPIVARGGALEEYVAEVLERGVGVGVGWVVSRGSVASGQCMIGLVVECVHPGADEPVVDVGEPGAVPFWWTLPLLQARPGGWFLEGGGAGEVIVVGGARSGDSVAGAVSVNGPTPGAGVSFTAIRNGVMGG